MKTFDVKCYSAKAGECYMFDTNIWLYINGPVVGYHRDRQSAYSNLLKDILDKGASIVVTSLILSEYVNRLLRYAFDCWKKEERRNTADFKKDFRLTPNYLEVLQDVKEQVADIMQLPNIVKFPDNFQNVNLDCILNQMNNECDYNDSYMVYNCERNNYKLVSDDRDLRNMTSTAQLITFC